MGQEVMKDYQLFVDLILGDINGDGMVGFADAIAALQILSGLTPAEEFYLQATLRNYNNGVGQITLMDVIYILQKVGGLRP